MLAARAKMLAGLTLLTFWSLSFADRVWRADFLLGGLPEPFQKKTWLFAWKTTSPLSVRFVKKLREWPSCSSRSHLLSSSIKYLPTRRAVIGHRLLLLFSNWRNGNTILKTQRPPPLWSQYDIYLESAVLTAVTLL